MKFFCYILRRFFLDLRLRESVLNISKGEFNGSVCELETMLTLLKLGLCFE